MGGMPESVTEVALALEGVSGSYRVCLTAPIPPIQAGTEHWGEEIRRFREERGLDQQEAAERIGVTIRSLRQWECGERCPKLHWQETVTLFLGYDPGIRP